MKGPVYGRKGKSVGRTIVMALLSFVLLAACRGPALIAPEPVTIRIVGSTSFTATLHDLASAYEAAHSNVTVAVEATGSTDGLRALAAGEADLAAVSWQFAKSDVPAGLEAVPVARDAVDLVVHASNPVTNVTMLQIKALYAGEMLDWRGLGGPADELTLISREDGSGTRAAFEGLVMGGERVTLNALVMPGSQAVVDYVAKHRGAIGYVTMGEVNDKVHALSIEDVAPTAANVRSGAYHLSRLIYLYRAPCTQCIQQNFVDFLLSSAGQTIVARRHVPIR